MSEVPARDIEAVSHALAILRLRAQLQKFPYTESGQDLAAGSSDATDATSTHGDLALANVRALQVIQNELAATREAIEAMRQGVVRLSDSGEIKFESGRARHLIDAFIPCRRRGNHLPVLLQSWIRGERVPTDPDACRKMRITRDIGTLDVRLVRDSSRPGWLLLLDARESRPTDRAAAALPPRMREVLELILEGLSEKEIAAKLGLQFNTVHGYVKKLYQRFGVSSRAELMARWIER